MSQFSTESQVRIVLRYHPSAERDADGSQGAAAATAAQSTDMQCALELPFANVREAAEQTTRLALPLQREDGQRIGKLTIDCRLSLAGDGDSGGAALSGLGTDAGGSAEDSGVEVPMARARVGKLVKAPVATKRFKFLSETSGSIQIVDTMTESPFSLSIPSQLLSLYSKEDRETTSVLDSLGSLHGPVQTARRIEREWALERIMAYSDRLSKLDACDITFKQSVHKKKADFDMMPTNLHLAVGTDSLSRRLA